MKYRMGSKREFARTSKFTILFILLLSIYSSPLIAFSEEIHVIKSRSMVPYDLAIKGFISKYGNDIKVSDISGDVKNGKVIAQRVKKENPKLIIAVGSLAANALADTVKDTPVICMMVSRPEKYYSNNSNFTGIGLNPDPVKQLELVRKAMPNVKKVGIIYSKANLNRAINRARLQSDKYGIVVVEETVNSVSDLPEVLRKIRSKTDVLLLVVDEFLISEPSLEYIMKFSIEYRYPIIGFSKKMVKSGALMSSISEYEDIGVQAAEMAIRLIKNGSMANDKFEYPNSNKYVINKKTEEILGQSIPQEVIENAAEVYE